MGIVGDPKNPDALVHRNHLGSTAPHRAKKRIERLSITRTGHFHPTIRDP